jgi:tetratricopeptide (TPR) repeat protein
MSFRALPDGGGGKILFNRIGHGADRTHRNKAQSMTAIAFAPSIPDADIAGSFVARQLRIGVEHYAAGEIEQAINAYQRGLAVAAENESTGHVTAGTIAELHAKLGNACMVRGDLESAAENYRAALRLASHLTACWCNLGNVHLQSGRPQEAITLYRQALKLNPGHWPSRTNLIHALVSIDQHLLAKMLMAELVDERPQDARLHHQLGKLHFELNELAPAIECFRQAVVLNPGDSDSIYWIGSIKQKMGEIEAAEAAYVEAALIQPLIRRQAAKSPADFRILALFAPFAGNVPTEYLFRGSAYDIDTLPLVASREYDVEPLKQDAQVVVNLISDADQGKELLPLAAGLVDRLGRPTVNDPVMIQRTTRDTVADLLQGIPGCRIAKVLRQRAGTDLSPAALWAALRCSSSILARPVGTHGGDDFEKIDDPAELAAFLAQRPDADRYLLEYIDYRSIDGFFRKYRFIFVDGRILPYHLAIGNHWKLHHDSTDMADQPWMQREEEAFLNDPAAVFNAAHDQVLRTIRQRIGLDFFGIDCALDRSGNLVVFEVNASMLVHDGNEGFPYKAPFVLRIKCAFDEMLRKFAIAGVPEARRA